MCNLRIRESMEREVWLKHGKILFELGCPDRRQIQEYETVVNPDMACITAS